LRQRTSGGGGAGDEVETFLVDGVVNPGHPGIPADMTLISSATLQTIRDQMAASVRRMKELEDENHALRQLEVPTHTHTHTHTHTFNGPSSRTTRVNHASTPPLSFLQAGCPSCHPTNSSKALKEIEVPTYGNNNNINIVIIIMLISLATTEKSAFYFSDSPF